MSFKKIFGVAVLCTALTAGQVFAQDDDDADFDEGWLNFVPATSYWGLRGLPGTVSGEALGVGRFNIALFGSYFKQDQDLTLLRYTGKDGKKETGGPGKDADVLTMRLALSYGVDDNISIYGVVPWYVLMDDKTSASIGQLMGGIHYSIPVPSTWVFRPAVELSVIVGMRPDMGNTSEITVNPEYVRDESLDYHGIAWSYAGYDYFEARKRDNIDFILKAPLSFVHGNLRRAFKIHYNPGVAITPTVSDPLFLNAFGIQIDPIEFMTVGLELNSRTVITNVDIMGDPLWFTPSLGFRSSYYANGWVGVSGIVGADIRLSEAKKTNPNNFATPEDHSKLKEVYSLEQWRIFGDIVLSIDVLASQRAELRREARRNAAEKARLKREAEMTAAQKDSIARKAQEDSLRLAAEMMQRALQDSIRAKEVADSMAAEMGGLAERARQDSIAQAQAAAAREAELLAAQEQQRVADSIALAEAQKRLEEERAKRSEAENMLLTTGMIVLDAVYFQTGRTDIHLNSRPYLTTIAKMLAKYPKLKLEIGGHSDNTGRFETNMSLSQRRAEAVMLFMQNVEPVLGQMLTARGYGPTSPKADNNTAAGREQNRRVELKVLNPEVLKEYNP